MSSTNHFVNDCDFVNFVNSKLHNFLQTRKENVVPLGPAYSNMNHSTATANLQLYRSLKKFEMPSDEAHANRREAAIADMLAYDSAGLTRFNPGLDCGLNDAVRHTLYNARKILHEAVSSYSFSVSALELTDGETYVSARGDTSPYAKLRDIKQWCVTADCFPLAARLIYDSPMLRFAAKRHIRLAFKKRIRNRDFSRDYLTPWWMASENDVWVAWNDYLFNKFSSTHPEASKQHIKYLVFCHKLKQVVTIVLGARVTSVPKNIETDRVIECECWLNMLVQRAQAINIRKCIKKHFSIDLLHSQDLHKSLISDLSNVTIDLRNASNSNWYASVKWLMEGTHLWNHIDSARCGLVRVDQEWFRLNMLSPMGNGYTFEVMTLVLLCVSRSLDSFSHVYGDDIIIDADVAPLFIETIKYVGYKLNEQKTFLNGEFRESCGAFFCEGYITSYDLHYAEDIVDAIILTNKIGIMANATDSELASEWLRLHHELLFKAPLALLRGFDFTLLTSNDAVATHVLDLADGLFADSRWVRNVRKKDPRWGEQHKRTVIDHLDLICDLCYHPSQFSYYRYVSKRSITYDDSRTWRATRRSENAVPRLLGWFYIWAGRVIAPSVNRTRLESTWRISFTEKPVKLNV